MNARQLNRPARYPVCLRVMLDKASKGSLCKCGRPVRWVIFDDDHAGRWDHA